MPRGIQRKGAAGKSMGLVVVGAGGKPAGQNAEVGRAIAAAAAPFVECRDGGQNQPRSPLQRSRHASLYRACALI